MQNVEKNIFDDNFSWLFQQARQVILCLTTDYLIIDVNKKACNLFGVSRKKVLHKPVSAIFSPFGLEVSFSKNNREVIVKSVSEDVVGNLQKSRRILGLKWRVRIMTSSKQDMLLVYVEESDTEELEQEVVDNASDYMRLLAGNIAHEIRTPLAIIGINSDLLMLSKIVTTAKGKDKEELDSRFKSIKYAIELASHIVDNMLVMLRTLSSKDDFKSKFERLSVANDLKHLLEIYPFLDHEKSLVQVSFGELKDFIYYGDKILTQYILFNLLKNALRAIKEVDKGKIKITLIDAGRFNELRIVDTSLGIAKDKLADIFKQFVIGKKESRVGLGLSFCKMVMGFYGGDIVCNSQEGKYTEFVLSFPKV